MCRRLSFLFLMFSALTAHAEMSGSMTQKAIAERLKPEAQVNISGVVAQAPSAEVAQAPGEKLYHQVCHTCHEGGLLGAPKFGDKDDWAKRIAEGMDVLLIHAVKGYNAMPPKGGCATCTDEDIHKAIQYMVSQIH